LSDDVIKAEKPCLQQIAEHYQEIGGNLVAAMEAAPHNASSYGILDVAEDMGAIVRAKGMVEKPQPGEAPSNLGINGHYILSLKIMKNLNKIRQGAGGEIQLTDPIAEESKAGTVFGFRFVGQRYDCGSKTIFCRRLWLLLSRATICVMHSPRTSTT